MAVKRNKNSALGIIRYNKVLAASRKALKKQGYDLSYNEARTYVSNYIYPALKRVPTYRLYNTVITKEADRVIKYNEPGAATVPDDDNIDFLNWGELQGLEFWQIPEVMETLMPDNANVQINAGSAGEIKKFKASSWGRKLNQWHEILTNIRFAASTPDKPGGQSGEYYWVPIVKHIPGKPNNRAIENYVIEFSLHSLQYGGLFNEKPEEEKEITPIEPKGTREKGSKKREKSKEFQKKIKEKKKEFLQKQKSKKVQLKRKPTASQLIKISQLRNHELDLLRKDFKDGIYTKAQYKKERQKIINKYPI